MKITAITLLFILLLTTPAMAEYSNEQIANAIYKAEGGTKTAFPYGILQRYKHTTPRQACINTIKHAKKDFNGKDDFIVFLGSRYCPVGCNNDNGTNRYWVKNVKYFLKRGDKQ
jgi:hypothetical protein